MKNYKRYFVLIESAIYGKKPEKIAEQIKEKEFETIQEFTKYMVNDHKLLIDQFKVLSTKQLVNYFNKTTNIDQYWLTFVYIK